MQIQHPSTTRRVMATTLSAALMLVSSTSTFAQQPTGARTDTFEKGTYVVWTTDGAELRGQLERMDRDSLRLRVGLQPWDVPMDRVEKVQHRGGDPLSNGATIGALIGGAALAWPAAMVASEPELGGAYAIAILAAGAINGALFGALIDKLSSSNRTLYERPRIALTPTRGGVTVAYHMPLGGR